MDEDKWGWNFSWNPGWSCVKIHPKQKYQQTSYRTIKSIVTREIVDIYFKSDSADNEKTCKQKWTRCKDLKPYSLRISKIIQHWYSNKKHEHSKQPLYQLCNKNDEFITYINLDEHFWDDSISHGDKYCRGYQQHNKYYHHKSSIELFLEPWHGTYAVNAHVKATKESRHCTYTKIKSKKDTYWKKSASLYWNYFCYFADW